MAGDRWPTPSANDAHNHAAHESQYIRNSLSLPCCAKLWPTPTARDHKDVAAQDVFIKIKNGGWNLQLGGQVKLWPTPSATDHKGSGVNGEGRDRLDYATERGLGKDKTFEPPKGEGSLNPAWVCAHLMNWPAGWDSLEPLPENSIKEWKEKTLAGTWWSEEPDIPRIGKNIPDRVKRLKVLGNGMVPLCFAVAFEELSR